MMKTPSSPWTMRTSSDEGKSSPEAPAVSEKPLTVGEAVAVLRDITASDELQRTASAVVAAAARGGATILDSAASAKSRDPLRSATVARPTMPLL